MRKMLCLILLLMTLGCAHADLQSDMISVADSVFSGDGSVDQVEWSNFTFQILQNVDPIDIGSIYKSSNNLTPEQKLQAQQLFLKSQGLAATFERQGKSVTNFLSEKGFSMAIHDHENSPALIFFKDNEPTRRFEFLRVNGQLKLARVILLKPSPNS
jgi:hypothetical protein